MRVPVLKRWGKNPLLSSRVEDKIFERILPGLHLLLLIGAVVALFDTLLVLRANKDLRFVLYDICLFVWLLFIFLFRKRLTPRWKIGLTAIALYGIGLLSFFYSGFVGVGPLLFLVGTILNVAFLPVVWSRLCSGATVLAYLVVALGDWPDGHPDPIRAPVLQESAEWANNLVGYLLLLLVIHVVMETNKRHLIAIIGEAEGHAARAEVLAFQDTLTGLPNRQGYMEKLKTFPLERGWMVLFEVKNLNMLNSVHGVDVGDQILASIGEALTGLSEGNGLAGRTGGNEFAWLMPDVAEEDLGKAAVNFRRRFLEGVQARGLTMDIRFRAGYTSALRTELSDELLYQRASIALEQARQKNNAFMTPYVAQAEQEFRTESRIRDRLGEALLNREIQIYFQEQMDCLEHRVIGLEALSRWISPDLGFVSPAVFIPIVEKSGLAVLFGQLVYKEVLAQFPLLREKYGWDIPVSINISPTHLLSSEFTSFVLNESIRTKVPPHLIVFEITEETFIENIATAAAIISELRMHGFQVSLDDFGTGYSSLHSLSELELDEVKIDRAFIQRLNTDPKVATLISSIFHLQQTYGFRIVAEGVETQAQCDSLLELGGRIVQGYLFSKPAPLEEKRPE